ncbi:MAG: ATP-binding protein [Flavobacteriia bacterium]|nr:ATP-binding protein [Flavobacteriia bacterium]
MIVNKEEKEVVLFENIDFVDEIIETIVAFANTSGGIIQIGKSRKGKIKGIEPTSVLKELNKAIKTQIQPEIIIVEHVKEEGFRLVVELDISESLTKGITVKNKLSKYTPYVRVENENLKASSILVKVWKFQKHNNIVPLLSLDEKRVLDIIADSSLISLNQIYKKVNLPRKTFEYILVRLINWNLLRLNVTKQATFLERI